jgi:hypothetical protein
MFLFLSLLSLASLVASKSPDKVRLTEIDVLTFVRGKQTTARRSSALPQLKCVKGACDAKHQPATVQCRNVGTDGSDVNWKCEADLGTDFKFGQLEVSCEGYASSSDEFVLVGSCGLEYELIARDPAQRNTVGDASPSSDVGTLIMLVAVGFFVLVCCCRSPSKPAGDAPYVAPRYGGVRSPDDPPPYSAAASQPVYSSSSGSSLPSALSLASAGAAGFALGRATAPSAATPSVSTSSSSSKPSSSSSSSTSAPSIGFATTKRR